MELRSLFEKGKAQESLRFLTLLQRSFSFNRRYFSSFHFYFWRFSRFFSFFKPLKINSGGKLYLPGSLSFYFSVYARIKRFFQIFLNQKSVKFKAVQQSNPLFSLLFSFLRLGAKQLPKITKYSSKFDKLTFLILKRRKLKELGKIFRLVRFWFLSRFSFFSKSFKLNPGFLKSNLILKNRKKNLKGRKSKKDNSFSKREILRKKSKKDNSFSKRKFLLEKRK